MYQKKLVRLGINFLFCPVDLAGKIQGLLGSIAAHLREKGYSQLLTPLSSLLPAHSSLGSVESHVKAHCFSFSNHCFMGNGIKQTLVFNTQLQTNAQFSTII